MGIDTSYGMDYEELFIETSENFLSDWLNWLADFGLTLVVDEELLK